MPFRHAARRAVATAAVAALTVGLAACGSGDDSKSSAAQATPKVNPELKGQVTIGAVLPLTGASATIGKDQQRGIELAVDKINSGGGVLGKKLVVKVEDSEGQAASAVNAARKLVSVDKTPVVIGEYSSGNTIPIGQYLQQRKVVHINAGSSSPDIAKIGDFSFSVIGLDNIAGKFTAEKLVQAGYHKVAFLAPNNAYGTGLLKATRAALQQSGGQIVQSLLYTEGQSDYRQELQRLKSANADIVIYSAYGKEAATINKEAYQLGMDPRKFFGIYLTMCTTDSDPRAVDGQQGMDVNYIGPNGSAYKSAYEAKYGEGFRTSFSGYTYDAVMMAAKAINQAGSVDPAKIRDALATVGKGYEGVTGAISFDAHNQRSEQPYLIATMKDGKVSEEGEVRGPEA